MFNDYTEVECAPSAPTISRGRRKIDVAMMYFRRDELKAIGLPNLSIQVSSLATPVTGLLVRT